MTAASSRIASRPTTPSKQSENKMHDDTVAKRFGFSGGLVPGVDVMAYMMHLPVAKWGRAFLERGLIEARFVKPVYDGEIAEAHGEESNGVLSIQVAEPRRALRDRHRVIAGIRADRFRLPTLSKLRRWRSASRSMPLPMSSANGSAPRRATGRAERPGNIWPIFSETDPIYAQEGLGHPGLLQRVMNKVLVDNAIMGPWIHVGSRMQLLSAAKHRRCIDRPRKSHRQLRQEGPPLRRTRRAGRRQRQDAAGALPSHRDLPAARAGGGVGEGRHGIAPHLTCHSPRRRGIQYAAASRFYR